MIKPHAVLTAVALFAGLGTGQFAAAKVSIVQSASPALARGSTYAWASLWGAASGAPAPAIVNAITAQQLQAATDSSLSAKGYRRLEDPAEADLIVTFRVITASRLEARLDGWASPEPFFGGWSDYRLITSTKIQGTLVMDMIERRTGQLVYRATSEKDVNSRDIEPKRLDALLKEMTKSLPSS